MAIYKNKVIKMRKKINKIKMGFFLKIEDSIKKLILIRIFKITQSSFTFLIFPFQELISQVKPINLANTDPYQAKSSKHIFITKCFQDTSSWQSP